MHLVRASLLAIVLGALGCACGGADEPEDTTPATIHDPALEGGEGGVGSDGAKANVNSEVKAGSDGAKAGDAAGVDADDDGVKAGANAQGTTDGSKDSDDVDQQKQQPLPPQDPNQPNPEQPQQPPQPEQPQTGTTP